MKLTIEAFRGVNALSEFKFKPKNNLTILYGENGSGKTTISDAFEFVFHGLPGSLSEKSLDGQSRLSALIHTTRKKSDLKVIWQDGNEVRHAQLNGAKAFLNGDLTTHLCDFTSRPYN